MPSPQSLRLRFFQAVNEVMAFSGGFLIDVPGVVEPRHSRDGSPVETAQHLAEGIVRGRAAAKVAERSLIFPLWGGMVQIVAGTLMNLHISDTDFQ